MRFASQLRLSVSASLAVVCLLLATTACQPPATDPLAQESVTGEDQTLQIAVIPKGTTHIYWQSVEYGARQAGEEFGAEITFRGPQRESDRDEQINVVQGFLNKQVDGICLAPLDADALVRPVQEARRGNVPVVVFDSGLNASKDDIVSYVATDNFRGGQLAADTMAKALDEQGNVVLLRYNKGSESTHQREEGFLEGIAKYPDIQVISSDQFAGTTTESAIDKAQQVFNKFGDQVDGIFAVCEPNAEGVLRALKDRNLAGQVEFVAFDSSQSLQQALKADQLTAIILQDPVRMGYLSVKTMVDHLRGKEVDEYVDTGVFVATPQNMNEEKIQSLLNPPRG